MDRRAIGPARGLAGQFLAGASLLPRGLAMYGRSPALVVLGIVPALIAGVLVISALVALLFFVNPIAAFLTGFADGWDTQWRTPARYLAGAAVIGVALLLGLVTFTALTVTIGDPFYENISERIEERLGGVPGAVDVPWWRQLGPSLRDSLRLVALSGLFGVPLFLAGLLPLVGQTVVPVFGALVGGWLLAMELTGVAFGRRGMRLADRRRVLRAHRPMVLGFGTAVFVCFLIPLGAIVLMPAAVSGATLLARRTLGLPINQIPAGGGPPGGP